MKRTLAVLALLLAPTVAHAWTTADTYREAAYDALLVVDARQTAWAMERPGYRETNPLLGSHPSRRQINEHMAIAAALHGLVSLALPDVYRRQWQWGTVAVEGFVVAHNAYLGARFTF